MAPRAAQRRMRSTLHHLSTAAAESEAPERVAVHIPSSQLVTPPLSEKLRSTPEYRPEKSQRKHVTEQEVNELKTAGYFVKRGLLAAEPCIDAMVESMWAHIQPMGVIRNSDVHHPSWIDPGLRWDVEGSRMEDGTRREDFFTGTENWKWHQGGFRPETVEMCNHKNVLPIVEELIGGPVKHSGHARGLYCIFPTRLPTNKVGTSMLHRDSQPFQIGIVVYLRDVEVGESVNRDGTTKRGGGAYTVLPGTHAPVYHSMASEYHSEPGPEHNRICKELRQSVAPVEIPGKAGDVIFWHHRLIHSNGSNTGDDLRMAVLCDYMRDDRPTVDAVSREAMSLRMAKEQEDAGKGSWATGSQLWMMHTREFSHNWAPRTWDMWEDWAI